MSRFRAFAIHLGISLVIFAALAALVLYVWYPDFFFQTDGGWQGVRLIILVDLVLGPLLTLIVYKAGKPGLKTDLTLIALFQSICLVAGTYVVYSERPIALVYVDGQFNSLTTDSFTRNGLEVPDLSQYPGKWPKWVMVDMPSDPTEQSKARRQVMDAELPTALLVNHYTPFDANHPLFTNDATALKEVRERDHDDLGSADYLAQYGGALENYSFYPYAARYQYFHLGFRNNDRTLAGVLKTYTPELELADDNQISMN